MVNNSKKDGVLPVRVTKELAIEARRAADLLGLHLPNLVRQLMRDLVRIADEKERPALPARVLTLKEEEILLRARA